MKFMLLMLLLLVPLTAGAWECVPEGACASVLLSVQKTEAACRAAQAACEAVAPCPACPTAPTYRPCRLKRSGRLDCKSPRRFVPVQ